MSLALSGDDRADAGKRRHTAAAGERQADIPGAGSGENGAGGTPIVLLYASALLAAR